MRVAILSLLLTLAWSTGAAEEPYHLQEDHYRTLRGIHRLMEEGDRTQALEQLDRLLQKRGLPAYDRAVALQTRGHLLQESGARKQAIRAYREALALGTLPPRLVDQIEYRIGRLLLDQGALHSGLDHLEDWLERNPDADGDALALIASALLQVRQYGRAGVLLERALHSREETTPEGWRVLLLQCYEAERRSDDAIGLLLDLVQRYPHRKHYWERLLWSYQRLDRPGDALALQELMYQRDMLEGDELVRLAASYIHQGMPLPAATLLERETTSGRLAADPANIILLVDSLLAAKEYDRAQDLLSSVAPGSGDGRLLLRLGRLQFGSEAWHEAGGTLRSALESGDLDQPEHARMLLAVALHRSGSPDAAGPALQQACSNTSLVPTIDQWVNHLNDSRMEGAAPIQGCPGERLTSGDHITRRPGSGQQLPIIQ